MITTNELNKCWFLVNPNQKIKEFEILEKEASTIFLDFIQGKNYGKGIAGFWFEIYTEPVVNYGRQRDSILSGVAHLSSHIDKPIFDKASTKEKLKLILNASFILIKYLAEKVPLPKDFQANNLVRDYENYLSINSFLIPIQKLEKLIIKPFETTRFNFIRTTTIEVDTNKIHYDLNEIEDFINNNLAGKIFGTSINCIHFGYELFDFNGVFANFHKQTENINTIS